MPTKRTPLGRPPRSRITPEAVALFRRCMEIREAGEHADNRDEYLRASVDLHHLLGRRLWQEDILDAADPTPPDYVDPDEWKQAHALYVELESRCSGRGPT